MPISGGSSGAPLVAPVSLFGNGGTVAATGTNVAIGAGLSLTAGNTLSATGGGGGSGIGTIIAGGITSTATSIALPSLPIISPAPGFTTWLNQDSTVETINPNGPLALFTLQTTAAYSARYKAAPVGAFTLVAHMGFLGWPGNGFGIILTDGTKLVSFNYGVSVSAFNIAISNFTNFNTFSSNPAQKNFGSFLDTIWQRIIFDGVNTYTFDVSIDGFTWQRIYQTAALFLVPTGIGIGINAFGNDATMGMCLSLDYWNGA